MKNCSELTFYDISEGFWGATHIFFKIAVEVALIVETCVEGNVSELLFCSQHFAQSQLDPRLVEIV